MNRETKNEIAKMQILMERMDKHYTLSESEALMNESLDELDARNREDVDVAEFFDLIGGMKGGAKSTIGYISSAKLNIPQVKRKNPETNRMKNYDDWETFGREIGVSDAITGVIKFASYTLNWRSPSNMTNHYNKNYVEPANAIRTKYGLPPMKKRESYTNTIDFGTGISTYNGSNNELQGHSYSPQDIGGNGTISSVSYYLIGENGSILKEISKDELIPYFKHSDPSGVRDLRNLNKGDEEIAAYAKEIASLNFKYTQFEHSSVVYVITSIKGEKKRFFNKNLTNSIKGININPQEFLNLAKQKYQLDIQQSDFQNLGEFDDEYQEIGE